MVFATHWHKSAMGIQVSKRPKPPSHLPLHPIPLGCPRVPAWSALFNASYLDWSSISIIWLFPGEGLFFFYFTILYWFCHTSTWILHRCTRVPHPEHPSQLPPHPIPLGHPSAPALSTLSHAWNLGWICFTYDNIHVSVLSSRIIPPSSFPTESKRLFYTSVSLLLSHIQGYLFCYLAYSI